MRTEITAGEAFDYPGFDLVILENLPTPGVFVADRAHKCDSIRKNMSRRGVLPVIPMRKSRNVRAGLDRFLYRLRNFAECCFNKLENARLVAPRYDKNRRELLRVHRHRIDPALAAAFVDMTYPACAALCSL